MEEEGLRKLAAADKVVDRVLSDTHRRYAKVAAST
jgi:hypothetical protein